MVCPYCNKQETNVVDSRKNNEGNSIRRRRECPKCNLRFTTYEKAEIGLFVQKRSGELQEFNYEKLFKGIENAFGGLDLNENLCNFKKQDIDEYINPVSDNHSSIEFKKHLSFVLVKKAINYAKEQVLNINDDK